MLSRVQIYYLPSMYFKIYEVAVLKRIFNGNLAINSLLLKTPFVYHVLTHFYLYNLHNHTTHVVT
jgi:hypothetical protein